MDAGRQALFDATIDQIYASVLEPDGLRQALAHAGRLFEASSIGQWRMSKATGELEYFERVGLNEAAERDYANYFRHLDPAAEKGLLSPVGTWVMDGGAIDPTIHSHREFYHDFCLPHRIGAVAGCKTFETDTALVAYALQRLPGQQPFAEQRADLERLLPHLTRSETLRERLGGLAGANADLERALDVFGSAVVLVDRTARVRFLNAAAARACAGATSALRLVGRRLVARVAGMQPGFGRAVEQATGLPPQASGLSVWPPSGLPWQVIVAPLPPGRCAQFAASEPLAMVLFEGAPEAHAESLLRGLFGLTLAEARLTRALASGETLQSVHESTGVGLATLRTQLAKAFVKCGVSSQPQLVALVRRLPTIF